MNINTHLLKLMVIKDKLDRGEKPTEAEVAYVRWLWSKIYPVMMRLAQSISQAAGMTIPQLATRLEVEDIRRRKQILREAMHLKRQRRTSR